MTISNNSSGYETERRELLRLFNLGVAAANPAASICDRLTSDSKLKRAIENAENIFVVAMGKAALTMARAAVSSLPYDKLAQKPLVVTNSENRIVDTSLDIRFSGHPIPDEKGIQAAIDALEIAEIAGENDLLLTLVSGGASAMMPCPPNGIELRDKQAVTDLLLASGASIDEINVVRKHLSDFKGGRYGSASHPAVHYSLILSDVIGDDLSAIASGPTVADPSTFQDAMDIIQRYDMSSKIPGNVTNYLQGGVEGKYKESIKSGDTSLEHCYNSLVGSNGYSVDAIFEAAGNEAHIVSKSICGDVNDEARKLVAEAKKFMGKTKNTQILIGGGETTVQLTGTGKGGRNQQFALAFAIDAEKQGLADDWVFLSGGTDGRDGPTDAAGGVVDSDSLTRMRANNVDPQEYLKDNNAYEALAASDDLINIGGTGTNVADLQILKLGAS